MAHRECADRAIVAVLAGVGAVLSLSFQRPIAASGKGQPAEFETSAQFQLRPAVVFTSTRDNPTGVGSGTVVERIFDAAELYVMLMADDGTRASEPVRLTSDESGDGFAAISPSGKQLVFDSNRARIAGEPYQISDLFTTSFGQYDADGMQIPGGSLLHLTRGSSATWSPDGKRVAFHASQSGVYTTDALARSDPGTPTLDSDIFVLNVDDCLANHEQCATKLDSSAALPPFMTNLTEAFGAGTNIDEDPDWSPDGTAIAFTRHDGEAGTFFTANHNNVNAEIYLVSADGGSLEQVTHNVEEERSPAWSPDGSRILYSCRRSNPPGQLAPFQLCVIERDGEGTWVETQLTNDGKAHLTSQWSPDGRYIVFHRTVSGQMQLFRLEFFVAGDGTPGVANETQLTGPLVDAGLNAFASWDLIRVHVR